MAAEVFMPKMSDHMETGEIVEWLVPEGSTVEKGQPILAIMTDKATVELEAPVAGVLKGIRAGVAPGVLVPVGETVAFIAAAQENVRTLPPLGGASAQAAPPPTARWPRTGSRPHPAQAVRAAPGEIRATPVVRKLRASSWASTSRLLQGRAPKGASPNRTCGISRRQANPRRRRCPSRCWFRPSHSALRRNAALIFPRSKAQDRAGRSRKKM